MGRGNERPGQTRGGGKGRWPRAKPPRPCCCRRRAPLARRGRHCSGKGGGAGAEPGPRPGGGGEAGRRERGRAGAGAGAGRRGGRARTGCVGWEEGWADSAGRTALSWGKAVRDGRSGQWGPAGAGCAGSGRGGAGGAGEGLEQAWGRGRRERRRAGAVSRRRGMAPPVAARRGACPSLSSAGER